MELVIISALILLNGLFAMFEIALVSSRKTSLEEKAKYGNKKAKIALNMLQEPERILSAIQVGITMIGIISGAYGGLAIAEDISPFLKDIPYISAYSDSVSVFLVIGIITYLSLIIGELVPKTLAMNNAEGITIALALFMNVFTKLTKPVVWFLSISTKIVLKIFRIKSRNDQYMSEEELILLLKQVSEQGVIESEESEIITEVMRLGDKKALNILVPRKDVCWLDLNNPVEELIRMASASSYSKLLVCESNIETIKGYIIVKDLLIEYFVKGNHNLTDILINPHFIPEQMSAVKILSLFRDSKKHFGVVVNEFGDISGIITLHDLAENIMGDFPEINENFSPDVVERDDKSWLVNGSMPVSDFKSNFSIPYFYKKNKDPESVATVGGLIMFLLKSIPKEGDSIILFNYRIEVVDMDGLRVDKVLISTIK